MRFAIAAKIRLYLNGRHHPFLINKVVPAGEWQSRHTLEHQDDVLLLGVVAARVKYLPRYHAHQFGQVLGQEIADQLLSNRARRDVVR